MAAVLVLLFIFLTLPDSAYMSESSLNTEACQAAKKHDRGPTGLPARSTKSHSTLDSAVKEINWASFTKFGQIIRSLIAWNYSQKFYFQQWILEIKSLMKQNNDSKFDLPFLSFCSG